MKNSIKSIFVAPLALGLVIATSSIASAQVTVGVSNNLRNTVGVTKSSSDLEILEKSNAYSNTEVKGDTQTVKIESYGPNASAWLNLGKGGNFTGGSNASTNPTNPDPVVIGLYSNYTEVYNASTDSSTKVEGKIKSESVGVFNEFSLDANSYLK